jgi:hypothetical protein
MFPSVQRCPVTYLVGHALNGVAIQTFVSLLRYRRIAPDSLAVLATEGLYGDTVQCMSDKVSDWTALHQSSAQFDQRLLHRLAVLATVEKAGRGLYSRC